MKERLFFQPYNALGQFLQLPAWKRFGAMGLLLAGLWFYPLMQLGQLYEQGQSQHQQKTQLDTELAHQQRLFSSLKQKQQQQVLTPQMANQLAHINQWITQNAQGIQLLSSQWRFEQRPLLSLKIDSHFTELARFLNQFMQAKNLILLDLDIEKHPENNRAVVSNLTLQLGHLQESEREK